MPALPLVPGVIKVEVLGTRDDKNWANIFHVNYTGTSPGVSTLETIAIACIDSYNTRFSAEIGTDVSFGPVACTDLGTITTPRTLGGSTHNGLLTGAPLSAMTAMLVTKTVARRYRGGHPRTYFPAGDSTSLADATHWDTAIVAAFNSEYPSFQTDWMNSLFGSTQLVTEVNVSYYLDKALRVTPQVDAILAVEAQAMVASQRRRDGRH